MARQSHGRPLTAGVASRPLKRNTARSRNLNAFAIAQQENSMKVRVRPNRLGAIEEDSHDKTRLATKDHNGSDRSPKRRRINGQESSTDDDGAAEDSDGLEWHLGVDEDDDDSDLNSEEAMGESDEERFEGFAFGGSTAQSSKRPLRTKDPDGRNNSDGIDLQEGSQDDVSLDYENQSADEDGLGEGAIDLATALDMNEEHEEKRGQQKSAEDREAQHAGDSYDSFDDEEVSSEDNHSALSFSDDEDLGANHARLKSFVHSLEEVTKSDAPKKRSRAPVPLGEPSDYGLISSQKLTIADLLPTVTDPRLRESLKMLHNSEQKGHKPLTKGIPGKLDPPLPKRQQDRLDREAAYDKSKETLNRWIETVKRNRRAEHISFPLSDPDALAALGTNKLMPVSQSEAITPLEYAIQSIMHESGLASKNDPVAEEKMQAFEELQEKKIPIEETQFRRAELRKVRDLMFREEVRARRIKKIKSKAYRRVHRKERDKNAQVERAALAAAGALDSGDERERQDRRRAEERMGARHKESKWAKGMKASGRTVWDEDARVGINDLARKDDELRKRVEGQVPNQSDESVVDASDQESSDDISIDGYHEVEDLKLKQKLGELETADGVHSANSRLSSMPFMRKAESARRAANQAEIDQARVTLGGKEGDDEDEDESVAEPGGRRRFGFGPQEQTEREPRADEKNEFEEPQTEDEARDVHPTEKQTSHPVQAPPEKAGNARSLAVNQSDYRKKQKDVASATDNPWLSGPRKRKPRVMTDEPIMSIKALLPDHNPPRNLSKSRQSTLKMEPNPPFSMQRLTSPSESEDETRPAESKRANHRNEELVRMAFAGDDVFQAFADEKKATIDEEGDQVVDNSLPGWGNWTGAGISKKEQRRANSRKSTTTIKGINPSKRKDAKLERIIINEKRSKKNAKYLAPELPHPFESRQQYERSLRLPLGPEWTTKTTFQDATKPRVLLKQGIIRAMEKPIA